MNDQMQYPNRTIERLCAYRRTLRRLLSLGQGRIFSHDLAAAHRATAAQVRRDLMTIGFAGSPARGYEIAGLLERIGTILDAPGGTDAALVGLGTLGSALLAYFTRECSPVHVVASFDVDPLKAGSVVHGCACHPLADLERVLAERPVAVGIVAVPSEEAQEVATRLVGCGVRGLVNFAPALLQLPPGITCEDMDIAVSLEKVAYFARHRTWHEGR